MGPSCTGSQSCRDAQIGSVDSSCSGLGSCRDAQLRGVDLINSCNTEYGCLSANGNYAFDELVDCCNDQTDQCDGKDGLDIVAAGCVSYCLLYLPLLIASLLSMTHSFPLTACTNEYALRSALRST